MVARLLLVASLPGGEVTVNQMEGYQKLAKRYAVRSEIIKSRWKSILV